MNIGTVTRANWEADIFIILGSPRIKILCVPPRPLREKSTTVLTYSSSYFHYEASCPSLCICELCLQSTRRDSTVRCLFSRLPWLSAATNPFQQLCFSEAVEAAGCVIDGLMDPTCACTSYPFENTQGGHDTAIEYALILCSNNSTPAGCRGSNIDLGKFEQELSDICFNKE